MKDKHNNSVMTMEQNIADRHIEKPPLHETLSSMPTIFNTGMDTNNSNNSCAFLSIYGSHCTRSESAYRISSLTFSNSAIEYAHRSLMDYCSENNVQNDSSSFLHTAYKQYKYCKENLTSQLHTVSSSLTEELTIFWKDKDAFYSADYENPVLRGTK